MLPPSSRATMFGLQTCIFAAANGLAARKARENVWINIAPAISACQVHISHARQHLILRLSTTQFVSALHANIISGILYSWPSEDETDKIDITASSDGNTKKKKMVNRIRTSRGDEKIPLMHLAWINRREQTIFFERAVGEWACTEKLRCI